MINENGVGNLGARLVMIGVEQFLVASLFADDSVVDRK